MITTEAWVLRQGGRDSRRGELAELSLETISFADIADDDVLIEPIYGSWEGNVSHALERDPIDICAARGEPAVVLGNCGVVRALRCGANVQGIAEGDYCWVAGNVVTDPYGYMIKALAYDAPHTYGLLAKQSKMPARCLIPIPKNSRHSLQQWAAFGIRYVSAWANWKIAYQTWRLQMPEELCPVPYVVAWGGGVAFAELLLAKHMGAKVAMVVSKPERIELCHRVGITPIDRREFADLHFDDTRYQRDNDYKVRYQAAENIFLQQVQQVGDGQPVSIFIDNIGAPVHRATLKALGRQGVITTAGWKEGMVLQTYRAMECINRHQHIHTHYARSVDCVAAMHFAENTGWMPPIDTAPWRWDEIPQLSRDYYADRIGTYFPLFQINPE